MIFQKNTCEGFCSTFPVSRNDYLADESDCVMKQTQLYGNLNSLSLRIMLIWNQTKSRISTYYFLTVCVFAISVSFWKIIRIKSFWCFLKIILNS